MTDEHRDSLIKLYFVMLYKTLNNCVVISSYPASGQVYLSDYRSVYIGIEHRSVEPFT